MRHLQQNIMFSLILFSLTQKLDGQADTLFFFEFEKLEAETNSHEEVISSIRNNNGVFQDASPYAIRTTAYGGHNYKNADFGDYAVGKYFLYHSPSWFTPDKKDVSFNHIELELDSALSSGHYYKISFLISNMKSHRYKPSHYGVRFSENRIVKKHHGALLSDPDIFFAFEKDQALDEIHAIIYAETPIKFIYFGIFAEDSLRVQKEFTPISLKQSYSDTAAYIRDSKPTRVIIDNIVIGQIEPLPNSYKEVYFDTDVYQVFRNGDLAMLRELTSFLLRNPGLFVLVEGYTHITGTTDYNLNLSKKRAESIKQILVAGGVTPDKVITLGKGIFEFRQNGKKQQEARKSSILLFE